MSRPMTIGQVSRTTGVGAKTIRYYEQVGVLPPPSRTVAGYRQYTEDGVERLLFIRRARALGLPLRRLQGLAAALDGRQRSALRPRLLEVIRTHRAAVRRRIGELELLDRQLERVLRKLRAPARATSAGKCRCLETREPASSSRREVRV